MKFALIPFAAAAIAFSAGSTLAAEASSPSATTANATAQTDAKGYNPDEVVCRRVEVTGTRLGGVKRCMTRSSWDEATRRAREAVEDNQMHGLGPTMSPGH